MPKTKTYPVAEEIANHALINNKKYIEMYQYSISDPESFWNDMGKRID